MTLTCWLVPCTLWRTGTTFYTDMDRNIPEWTGMEPMGLHGILTIVISLSEICFQCYLY